MGCMEETAICFFFIVGHVILESFIATSTRIIDDSEYIGKD
jgi:hypothetical protein